MQFYILNQSQCSQAFLESPFEFNNPAISRDILDFLEINYIVKSYGYQNIRLQNEFDPIVMNKSNVQILSTLKSF